LAAIEAVQFAASILFDDLCFWGEQVEETMVVDIRLTCPALACYPFCHGYVLIFVRCQSAVFIPIFLMIMSLFLMPTNEYLSWEYQQHYPSSASLLVAPFMDCFS
jgi:hypothetical protein